MDGKWGGGGKKRASFSSVNDFLAKKTWHQSSHSGYLVNLPTYLIYSSHLILPTPFPFLPSSPPPSSPLHLFFPLCFLTPNSYTYTQVIFPFSLSSVLLPSFHFFFFFFFF